MAGNNQIGGAHQPATTGNRIGVTPHAHRQALHRRISLASAIEAVRRQVSQLNAICARPGERAAVDYRRGIAVVARDQSDGFQIITILEKWMVADNLPMVADVDRRGIVPKPAVDVRATRSSGWTIGAILAAKAQVRLETSLR